MGNATAAAEGAVLANFKFQPYKTKKVNLPTIHAAGEESEEWRKGEILANAQNFCKTLMETPANLLTPTIFCETVKDKFSGVSAVELLVHDEAWARIEKMNLFLSVTQGSSEPAKFLEVTYKGNASSKDIVALVGKGITFDSGGISIKSASKMDQMRADMVTISLNNFFYKTFSINRVEQQTSFQQFGLWPAFKFRLTLRVLSLYAKICLEIMLLNLEM